MHSGGEGGDRRLRAPTTTARYVAFLPQWDFLDFLAGKGAAYPAFHLRMEAEVTGLLTDGELVTGVTAKTPEGELRVAADLVVGADGRSSIVRDLAGLLVGSWAHRWMCSGSASRGSRPTRASRSAISNQGSCSS